MIENQEACALFIPNIVSLLLLHNSFLLLFNHWIFDGSLRENNILFL